MPIYGNFSTVATGGPGIALGGKKRNIRYASVQALLTQSRQLKLCHVEPTAMLRCVMPLQLISYTPSLIRLKDLV